MRLLERYGGKNSIDFLTNSVVNKITIGKSLDQLKQVISQESYKVLKNLYNKMLSIALKVVNTYCVEHDARITYFKESTDDGSHYFSVCVVLSIDSKNDLIELKNLLTVQYVNFFNTNSKDYLTLSDGTKAHKMFGIYSSSSELDITLFSAPFITLLKRKIISQLESLFNSHNPSFFIKFHEKTLDIGSNQSSFSISICFIGTILINNFVIGGIIIKNDIITINYAGNTSDYINNHHNKSFKFNKNKSIKQNLNDFMVIFNNLSIDFYYKGGLRMKLLERDVGKRTYLTPFLADVERLIEQPYRVFIRYFNNEFIKVYNKACKDCFKLAEGMVNYYCSNVDTSIRVRDIYRTADDIRFTLEGGKYQDGNRHLYSNVLNYLEKEFSKNTIVLFNYDWFNRRPVYVNFMYEGIVVQRNTRVYEYFLSEFFTNLIQTAILNGFSSSIVQPYIETTDSIKIYGIKQNKLQFSSMCVQIYKCTHQGSFDFSKHVGRLEFENGLFIGYYYSNLDNFLNQNHKFVKYVFDERLSIYDNIQYCFKEKSSSIIRYLDSKSSKI